MGYITCTTHIILLLVAYVSQVFAITTRLDHEVSPSRNFRRHIGTLPFPDWELGLREAVYQALLRERNLHPNLREYLYSAPIIGHQDSATPFGDIVILARGQLYSAPGGFQFVQDPYENDCDECHNAPPRCDRAPCENWRPEGHERILALWTVKRIRHRDSNYGYRYELEYKVSPMNVPVDEPFITRNGRFDYSMPGHTFIVKSNPNQYYDSTHQSVVNSRHDKAYRSPNVYDSHSSNEWSPNFGPNFEGRYLPPPLLPPPPPTVEEYYDEDPRKAGYPNVLYGPPQIYTQRPPPYAHFTTKPPETDNEEEAERELFKKLFETLSTKTSTTTTRQASLSTASTQNIFTPVMTSTKTSSSPQPTIPTHFLPTINTQSSYHQTSGQAPLQPTIPIQNSFQDNHLTTHKDEIVPTKPTSTMRFPTTITAPHFTTTMIRFPETVKYSEPDPLYSNSITPTEPTITSKSYPMRTTKRYKLPTRKFKTTPSDDYDIFGAKEESKPSSGMKFPGMVNNNNNNKVAPGEQVIKVVSAPTLLPNKNDDDKFGDTLFNVEQAQSSSTLSPRYQVNFNNTDLLQPKGKSYITIGLSPSTRARQSTLPTVNNRYETTMKQQTTVSSTEPITSSTYTNMEYTTLGTETPTVHQETVTIRPFTQKMEQSGFETSSTIHETVPFTRTTEIIRKTTTPIETPTNPQETVTIKPYTQKMEQSGFEASSTIQETVPFTRTTEIKHTTTTETPSSTHIITTSPPTLLTTLTSKATKPIFSSTKKYFPSTKTITPSSTRTTSTFTKGRTPSIETTVPPTKVYFPSLTRRTTSKQKIIPTRSVTRKYKPPTPSVATTISEETSTFSGTTATNYPIITSTIPSRSSETTIITTISIKDYESTTQPTVMTTNIDTSPPLFVTNITTISEVVTEPLPTSTLPITTSETTTPSPTTSRSTTRKRKIPTRTSSSTTRASEDTFLQEDKNDLLSKTSKDKSQYDEDLDLDLFGQPQEKATPKTGASKTQHKESFNSKEIDDIFGGGPVKRKQPVLDDDYDYDNTQTTTSNKVKIIYSGFFSPSTTLSSAEKITESNFKEESKNFDEETTTTIIMEVDNFSEELKNKSEPLTSQSYSTSVSVEVNKKNEKEMTTTTQDSSIEINNSEEYKPTTTTTLAPCNTTEKQHNKKEKNKIFDMLTLSVVNHAKSIDILNANNDENKNNNNIGNNQNNNSNNNTARERRYKRKRTYRVQKIRRRNQT